MATCHQAAMGRDWDFENQRIRTSFPLLKVGQSPGIFGEQDFVYDAAADTYRCPGKQTLRFLAHCQTPQRRISAAAAAVCGACALQAQCTTAKRGRRIGRQFIKAFLERGRGCHTTAP